MRVARHRTALRRTELSRPLRLALADGVIAEGASVLDYGCGQGDDLRRLRQRGYVAYGWDPVHRPRGKRAACDVVNLGYVVNVIEVREERDATLRVAWAHANRALVVSARLRLDVKQPPGQPHLDGYVTRTGTFQKFFDQSELREWIDSILGTAAVAAGPGVFYVFREEADRQEFLARRHRRRAAAPRLRKSDALFEQHREALRPLMDFYSERGRLPDADELRQSNEISGLFGSLPRAWAVVRRVTGTEVWERVRSWREEDLLVYLALSRFSGRVPFGRLPVRLQRDVRAFCGTYRKACAKADGLLLAPGDRDRIEAACRAATVGKLTPQALYVHAGAMAELPGALRVLEGCARAYVGLVDGANIVKIHRRAPQVSYLAYPEFDGDPHPALAGAMLVCLRPIRMSYRDYVQSPNPPILHRKEEFVSQCHPLRSRFARLTQSEETRGLFQHPSRIGRRQGWESELRRAGVALRGHRLIRAGTRSAD